MSIRVVNVVPLAQSGETAQDSEPNLAVNPADPRQIVATAFTPDPGAGPNAPIFVSGDGGNTWVLNVIVPSQISTGDITVRYGGVTGALYAGILRRPDGLRINILRTLNPAAAALMTVLVDRQGSGVDQPYVQAATRMGGGSAGRDNVFVGNNDFNAPAGRTATIDRSADGVAATPPPPSGFTVARLDVRATVGQDMPAIRPAVHGNGTVYAAFYGWRGSAGGNMLCDVVVVRDDNWGTGGTPFTALVEPPAPAGDALAGVRVVRNVAVPFNTGQAIGQERLVASNLSIAVDPRNGANLYMAWADLQAAVYTLHVRRSQDGGSTWSAADLRTVANATNPALAINSRGRLGFLYQQLVAGAPQRWVSHLELTTDDWGSVTDRVLSSVPGNVPVRQFGPYLGDYVHLMCVGKDFFGIFSANNTPAAANFPNNVTYQRNANFATQTLLAVDGVTVVNPSIDPFFFHEQEIPPEADFYVRDWTDNPSSGDNGLEPSTHPVFYATSDVWTRRTNAPGAFNANDQPANETPQQGTGPAGDNFAFVRVRRNASGVAATVAAHFLVSPFGTGSNYQDAGTLADPTLSFAAGDLVQTLAAGYGWHLDLTSTTHLCLAVEISTPTDPIVQPSLVGRAPGWPTTDLAVLWDNNKAQRNMQPGPVGASGAVSYFGLIHNAATFDRDLVLRYAVQDPSSDRGLRIHIAELGGRRRVAAKDGHVVITGMRPGENRWLRIAVESRGREGHSSDVIFTEMVGETPVNGFGIEARHVTFGELASIAGDAASAALRRLAAAFDIGEAAGLAERFALLSERPKDRALILRLVVSERGALRDVYSGLAKADSDPFAIDHTFQVLSRAADAGDPDVTVAALLTLANELDALQTMIQKARGDSADILQTVNWQRALYSEVRSLQRLPGTDELLRRSASFVDRVRNRTASADDYPALVTFALDTYAATARGHRERDLRPLVIAMQSASGSPSALQAAHRRFLLGLQE